MIGNKKYILIVGINGFLGSHLAIELMKDYDVIGLEFSLENLFRIKEYKLKVYPSTFDLEVIFQEYNFEAIIYTATVYRRNNNETLDSMINTNILLPTKLFTYGIKYNIKAFINTDSFFNDSKFNYKYLMDYTLSKKHSLEWLNLLALSNPKSKLFNLKVFHMYGPNDSEGKFVSQLISKLKGKVSSIDLTKGDQKRDFIYIYDVVLAYKTIIENISYFNERVNNIDVGTGIASPVRNFVEISRDYFSPRTVLKFGVLQKRENEIEYSCADCSLLNSIGWNPKYTIDTGIKNL